MAEKPTAAFILSLLAGIFGIIGAILIFAVGGTMFSIVPGAGGLVMAIGAWQIIASIIIFIGASMINSGIRSKVKTGGILVLIFSILVLNGLSFILGLIGGILALTWKPPTPPPTTPTTPYPTQPPTQPQPQPTTSEVEKKTETEQSSTEQKESSQ